MGQVKRVKTASMSREAWLQQRRKSIGGSDASGIIGLSEWSSPYSVWADKTGRIPPKPDNEAMRQGRDLEEYVARRWMESTGKKVKRVNAMLYRAEYPFAHADIDRWVIGENAGLECKTTSTLNLKQFKNVKVPKQYYVQCVHYMAVTGAERWYLGVLVYGRGFYCYTLERDQAEIDVLMESEKAFWDYVKRDTPPPVDGTNQTMEAIQAVYRDSVPRSVDLLGREALLQEYESLSRQQKELSARIRKVKQTLMADLKEREIGSCGRYTVTWKPQKRTWISREKLRAVYPNINLAKVMTTNTYRRFSIKEETDATD